MSPTIGASTPAELVPGNLRSLEQTARELSASGAALDLAARGLSRIDTSAGWSGQAADQFRKVFDNQPGKWKTAADAFDAAATALTTYAGVLEWAQGQAATAIKTWNAGDHQSAQRILNDARSDLSTAAGTAARAIGRARDLAPPKPGWLSELGHGIEDIASSAWHETVQAGEDTLGVLASFGNAIIHDRSADVETVVGVLAVIGGIEGEGAGVALDATGVGAIAGVAINVGSALAIVGGAATAGYGLSQLGRDAAGPDRVTMQSSGTGGSGSTDPGEPPPDNGGLGPLEDVNKPDPAADKLAERIGGRSRVKFSNGPDNEFDAVSDEYVAQAKPANFTLNKAFRNQAQTTFKVAIQSGRIPYFQFDGPPGPGVLEALNRYAARYGIEPVIDITPLGGS